jgi:hypothetical protein
MQARQLIAMIFMAYSDPVSLTNLTTTARVTPLKVAIPVYGGFDANDIYISGASGLIMHYDGTHWTQMRTGITTSGIVNIKGTAQHDLFAIGEGGLILQYKDMRFVL